MKHQSLSLRISRMVVTFAASALAARYAGRLFDEIMRRR